MTERQPKTERAFAELRVDWDEARTERTLAALPARGQRRRARRLAASAAFSAVVGAAAVVWLGVLPARPDAAAHGVAGGVSAERRMTLHDGSSVALLQPAARLELLGSSDSLVSLGLSGGAARFDVTKRPERRFRVQVGTVRVEVLGTRFTVEPRGAQVHVAVHEGRVQVSWGDERHVLGAAEQGLFPPAPALDPKPVEAAAQAPAASVDREHASSAQREEPNAQREEPNAQRDAPSAWREQAARGEFKAAYALLKRPEARVSSEVEELLLAADSARLSGHPAEAVPFLRRVVREHAADARAPLASFTLGNVLLNQLGLPREAEAAYAEARRGTRSETLAQDALARQVEAAHRAGEDALAQRLAEQYVKAYPEGRRLEAVRRFGGLR